MLKLFKMTTPKHEFKKFISCEKNGVNPKHFDLNYANIGKIELDLYC